MKSFLFAALSSLLFTNKKKVNLAASLVFKVDAYKFVYRPKLIAIQMLIYSYPDAYIAISVTSEKNT
ncbi:hypothetical protein TUM3792_45300 [Shewanella sp. MBTL60-007]|nr:hypothetical protein TUM3792_45300 [Shewanella sp. MBTL60-007]